MKKLIFLVLILGLIALAAYYYLQPQTDTELTPEALPEITADPLDTVLPFYKDWHAAVLDPEVDPFTTDLPTDTRLTQAVQDYIATSQEVVKEGSVEPVLCQSTIPERVGAKLSFNKDGKAQFLVLARGMGVVPERAVVDLTYNYDQEAWQIAKITCYSGEAAPDREFTFERTGFLLQNDESPLKAGVWYLVFEENDEDGHFAPLTFDGESLCTSETGGESVCAPDTFINPSSATVKGEMTEGGVNVKRVEFAP